MQYHYWVVQLFQPFVAQSADTAIIETSLKDTPQEIVRHSQVMFETLLRLYYLRHSYDTYDAWIIHFLIVLGTNALNALYTASTPTQAAAEVLRSSLVLAVTGLEQQSKNVFIAKICALGLEKSMRSEDLQWVHMYLCLKPVTMEEQRMIDENTRSSYPLPIVRDNGQVETRLLGEIVKGVEKLDVGRPNEDTDESS